MFVCTPDQHHVPNPFLLKEVVDLLAVVAHAVVAGVLIAACCFEKTFTAGPTTGSSHDCLDTFHRHRRPRGSVEVAPAFDRTGGVAGAAKLHAAAERRVGVTGEPRPLGAWMTHQPWPRAAVSMRSSAGPFRPNPLAASLQKWLSHMSQNDDGGLGDVPSALAERPRMNSPVPLRLHAAPQPHLERAGNLRPVRAGSSATATSSAERAADRAPPFPREGLE